MLNNKIILAAILTTSAYTPMNKILASNIGVLGAVFIGELIRQRERFKNITEQGKFYVLQNTMQKNISLSPKQQRLIIKKTSNIGLLEVTEEGLPKKKLVSIKRGFNTRILYGKEN